uniref:Uncharacterized protein n=1 Tax=Solanum tuberosum TaxID=4113 RepID=M1DPM0_SOLTU
MGSIATFRHNIGIGYHDPMVNTRYNGIRLVAPVNAPAEEFTATGRGRGRKIEEEVEVENIENVEEVGQEEEVQAEATGHLQAATT